MVWVLTGILLERSYINMGNDDNNRLAHQFMEYRHGVSIDPCSIHSLWPSDVIRWYKTGLTLACVMVCGLTAPSHYLNQCSLIISEVLWHSSEDNFTGNTQDICPWYMSLIQVLFPEANELKQHLMGRKTWTLPNIRCLLMPQGSILVLWLYSINGYGFPVNNITILITN